MVPDSKLLSLAEAVNRFVADGEAIALDTAQETLIPFAAGRCVQFGRIAELDG